MHLIKKYRILILLVMIVSFRPGDKKIRVFMAGDSTMAIKETRVYPEHGWGMPFVYFFDSTVTVVNKARNGRSTRTFIEEGLWESIIKEVKKGDYVFIQFGHNDESKEKTDRYTTPEQYKINLRRFIQETRDKKGVPVLLTPVSRRRFKNGIAIESHEIYSALAREVAVETKVFFIDLDKKSMELYQRIGEEHSKLLFLQLKPEEHPNYPEGKNDNTHFNELGARLIAQLVLQGMRENNIPLTERIVVPVKK